MPISGLVRLLDDFGVSEDAARCTISRLKRDGALAVRRDGGRVLYSLTRQGAIAAHVDQPPRPAPPEWDGRWWLVSYQLPGVKRAWREALRKQLEHLGYGRLAQGYYISPYGYREQLTARLRELGIEQWVDLYSAEQVAGREPSDKAAAIWDLQGLADRYQSFLDKHEPLARRFADLARTDGGIEPALALVAYVYLCEDHDAISAADPLLPARLLPKDWPGNRAQTLFRAFSAQLATPARTHYERTCVTEGGKA